MTLAATWLLICTLTAGWMKAFSADPRIGFFALANRYSDAASAGTILAPAKSIAEMQRVAFNNYICGTLTVMFVILVVIMAFFTVKMSVQAPAQRVAERRRDPPHRARRRDGRCCCDVLKPSCPARTRPA